MDFSSVPRLSGWSFPVTYLMGEFRQRRINFTPSAFSSLKLGAAVSPVDKLRKDNALPPVTSEKPTLFFRVTGIVGFCKGLAISSQTSVRGMTW